MRFDGKLISLHIRPLQTKPCTPTAARASSPPASTRSQGGAFALGDGWPGGAETAEVRAGLERPPLRAPEGRQDTRPLHDAHLTP